MDNLIGEIDCRSKSDGIVMGILRCAMDKAHEKVQSEAGSIDFLHERSKFYELAVILVESGLSIVQQETNILESNREKVISDLTEMRHWLLGRINVMKLLINEKDRELTERTENELKLRLVLESKEKEVIFLRDKLENQRTMSEGSLDLGLLLKNNEAKESDSKSDSELLNEERFQEDDFYGSYNHIPKIKPMTDSLRPEQNKVIEQMSSDIDILKETLDFAFGKRDNGEMVPVEKQWRCTIEKDILFVLIRFFINDIKQRFEIELRNFLGGQIPVGFSNKNLSKFISEMTTLCQELEAFYSRYNEDNKTTSSNQDLLGPLKKLKRTCSEPLPKVDQEDQEVGGSNYVAKLIKNHEYVIKKQLEDRNVMKKEVIEEEKSTLHKKDKELDFLNRMIKHVITRLDDISSLNVKSVDKEYVKWEEKFTMENLSRSFMGDKLVTSDCACEIIKDEVGSLKEEVDNLNLQILILEEIHLTLYEGLFKDQSVACFKSIQNTKSTSTLLLRQFVAEDGNSETFVKDILDGSIIPETIGSLLKEDVYEVFFVEMFKAWKEESDDFDMEVHIREEFYNCIMAEAVKDEISEYLNSAKNKKVEFDGTEESMIQKLDSLLKSLESEENLMVKASSEIEEHNVCHEQEILECEGVEERETIEWLLNDDESTFSSMNEKLVIAMKQLSTSKELLLDLEQSLGFSPDVLSKSSDDCLLYTNTSLVVEMEKSSQESIAQVEDSKVALLNVSDFHQVIQKFEVNVVKNLVMKSSRIEELKHQFHNLIVEPVSLIKKRKLLYKKAFLARCQNLKLAETEVDLLGNQVEALLHLLENIYMILDQNSTILSCHFQVFDILKLIKDELAHGVACASSSS
ncbi:WPP domain-associated protein [Lycium barbarum]|uniref:WPP domain-associated protein n=1 Tax=Lycium barbarum TaxID=112863 RepID=UPI00293EEBA4|nr:WPP domain-associated protein [Lycium barbarum]